ncbi:hypothetical protein C8D88_103356 [Lentzea atacamensis]|uniref:MFS transporter n=1 Tax=Lentzea atacamensis TaxID=531938 RepID=A0A316I6X2_9PSEU|nr:hypothetical protein [Lentzea atacamensis]PWK88160.1 hypothetical protein C8D88_103356 [Lentzea atacamensis]
MPIATRLPSTATGNSGHCSGSNTGCTAIPAPPRELSAWCCSSRASGSSPRRGALVPKLRWPAARLMRVGAPIALAGYGILTFASSLWLMAAAFLVTSVGLAVAGLAAAASLGVGPEHQGSIAGLINATTGLTFILGPLLSTALYEVEPVVPVIAAAVAAALAFGLSLRKVTPRTPQSVA